MAAGAEGKGLTAEGAGGSGVPAWSLRVTRWALVGFVALDPVSISLSQICVAVGVLSGAVAWAWGRREGREGGRQFSPGRPLWLPFLLFGALTVLSALFSENVPRSLLDAKQLFQILILYWTLGAAPDAAWARRLLHLFIIVAAAAALYGMGQFLLGEGEALARRPRGTLSHFQTFAGVLLLGTVPALSLAVARSVPRRERWFGVAASVVLVAGLLVSLTRGAWIGLGVGVVVLLALHGRAGWIWVLPVVAGALYVAGPRDLRERFLLTVRFDEEASGERLRMWRSGLRMMQDHPLLGVGVDMVKLVYPRYRMEGATRPRTGHLHSNPVQLGAERGLPALAVWVWIWVAFFRGGGRAFGDLRRREGRGPPAEVVAASLATVAAFLTAGLVEYNFGDSEVVMMVYFFLSIPFLAARDASSAPAAGGFSGN
ncbi:MAG: O-antigen ligase family protein [Nitrospinota bacterium]